ncbi:MAG TPA: hypothetical protein VNC50_04850 [Planctomycetia bacterium]|nr:hypothetical protein [Planctomycetia bacterium]
MSTDGSLESNPYADDPVASYRPVAATAVIALLGGIASLSAFFLPFNAIAFPVAFVLFGVYVSWRLEQARGEYTGQVMAKAGLLFALVAAVGVPTVHFVNYFVLSRESRPFADRFIDLMLENRVKSAFLLVQSPSVQKSAKGGVEDVMRRRGREEYVSFAGSALVGSLGGLGAKCQVTYAGARMAPEDRGVTRLIHHYFVATPSVRNDGTADVWRVDIYIAGAASPAGEWEGRAWWIESNKAAPYDPTPEEMKKFVAALK